MAREYYRDYLVRRIFLADGDALICKTDDLLYVMGEAKRLFPENDEDHHLRSAEGHIFSKAMEALVRLRDAGLEMVYVGAESGDDGVLEYVQKGATHAEIAEAGKETEKSRHKGVGDAYLRPWGKGTSGKPRRKLGEAHQRDEPRLCGIFDPPA